MWKVSLSTIFLWKWLHFRIKDDLRWKWIRNIRFKIYSSGCHCVIYSMLDWSQVIYCVVYFNPVNNAQIFTGNILSSTGSLQLFAEMHNQDKIPFAPVLKFLLTRLSNVGDVEAIVELGKQLSDSNQKSVTYSRHLNVAYIHRYSHKCFIQCFFLNKKVPELFFTIFSSCYSIASLTIPIQKKN